MAEWKDNNLSAVLEYPFDYERFIEEQLREIDDLDERIFAKKILINGLGEAIKSMDRKYKVLEQRVLNGIKIPQDHYSVLTTIVDQKHYDPTNQTLFPLCIRDIQKEEAGEAAEQGMVFLETIYLEADLKTCSSFLQTENFSGWKIGENKEEAVFIVRQAKRYREAIENLYQVFQDNQISWNTVNTAHLEHFFDVFMLLQEEEKGEKEETDQKTLVEFGAFEENVRRGYIPLWNIEHIFLNSVDFRMPCISEIYYEHEIILEDMEEDGYLIQFNDDILGVRHERIKEHPSECKTVIKSVKEVYKNWVALRIRQKKTIKSLDYCFPIVGNKRKDTFSRRYLEQTQTNLLTPNDVFRRIMELDIDQYIEVMDYEIINNPREYSFTEGMNWFVKDEFFLMETRKILLFKFREKITGNYLNDSMVKYAVSHMQLQLNEYRCVGIIVA